jgi:hypothetical protein
VLRSGDTCLAGQPQRDLFPGLHAVVVGLLKPGTTRDDSL